MKILFNGKNQCVAYHAKDLGLKPGTIHVRIRNGMDPIIALTTPLRIFKRPRLKAELKGYGTFENGKIHAPCGTDLRYTASGDCIKCHSNNAKKNRRLRH